MYVQFGSGFCAPDGWHNFDASPTVRFERLPLVGRWYTKNNRRFPDGVRYGDVVKGLPIAAGSCAGVYASHVLEHLALDDCRRALREAYRILAPGGIVRIVVPDLRTAAKRYVVAADRGEKAAAYTFMRDTSLGVEARPRRMFGRVAELVGNSRHLWMWDEAALSSELEAAGFVHIRRAERGDSGDPAFELVENPLRFADACAIQAERPMEGRAVAGCAPTDEQ